MVSGGAIWFAAIASMILIASALWAEWRFAAYDRLPRQFGFTLKPTSYGPRWLIIWLTPVLLIAVLGLLVFLPGIVPPEMINGDPDDGVKIASVALVGAQAFILWLLVRWANGQS